MSVVGGLAIFGIIWWVVLFAVLPFGIRSQEEAEGGGPVGTQEGAPARPMIVGKLLITTGIAVAVWLVVFVLLEFQPIALDDVPLLPRFGETADS